MMTAEGPHGGRRGPFLLSVIRMIAQQLRRFHGAVGPAGPSQVSALRATASPPDAG